MSRNDDLLTPFQAAEILGLFHTSLRWHIDHEHIPAQRYGRRNIILQRADVLKFKADREERGLFVR